jgi:hypothetical protein
MHEECQPGIGGVLDTEGELRLFQTSAPTPGRAD